MIKGGGLRPAFLGPNVLYNMRLDSPEAMNKLVAWRWEQGFLGPPRRARLRVRASLPGPPFFVFMDGNHS